MNRLSGCCHCGKIRLEVSLAQALAAYAPRACDCSFCRKHGAAYVSDPAGEMRVLIADPRVLVRYRQGSGQAEFLICGDCGVLMAVCCEDQGRRFGAVNAMVLDQVAGVAAAVVASPQKLGAEDKRGRWKSLWFPKVSVETP